MAGSTLEVFPTESEAPRRTWVRCLAVTLGLAVAGIVVGPAASAQVPPVPGVPGVPGVPSVPGVPGLPGAPDVPPSPDDLPPIPDPVQDAIRDAESTLVPVLIDVAMEAGPVSNAAGFALRPPCSGAGFAVLVVAIAGGSLPVSPGFLVTPFFIFCGPAYSPGPADPVFEQVDDAAGGEIYGAVQPVLDEVREGLTPVRPNLSEACSAIALAGSTPQQVPPPLNRFNFVRTVCG